MALSKIAVRRPIATTMFFTGVVILGIISLKRLSVDLFPNLNYPRLLVRTVYPHGTPDEVERFVTEPIEEALGGISGVKNMESHSSQGISLSFLEFYWGTDMNYAALNIREKLDEVYQGLPEEAERSRVIKTDPSAKPIMTVALSGIELGRLTLTAKDLIRRRLEELEGVAMVEVFGGVERRILVETDPERLNALNIDAAALSALIAANNLSRGGGTIRKGRYRYSIYIDGEIHDLEDIKNLAVSNGAGANKIFLRDIARVRYAPEERKSLTKLNGQPTIGLHVTKESGTNTVRITREAERVLKMLEKEIPGLETFVVSKQADFISDSINSVFSNLMWGGALAFLSLFVFLRKLKDPLNIGLSIPVSIIATFALMFLTDVNINMMSLGGLALGVGMLVDNSIVVLENIFRLREEGAPLVEAAVNGAKEVAMPVFASTLTSCAVFLPIIYVEGIAGRLFRDYSLTIAFSLLTSVFVSLSILPVLVSKYRGREMKNSDEYCFFEDGTVKNKKRGFLQKAVIFSVRSTRKAGIAGRYLYQTLTAPVFRGADWMIRAVFDRYHRFVVYALDHKGRVVTGFFVLASFAAALGSFIDVRLLPPVKQNQVRFALTLPEDATSFQTEVVAAEVEDVLRKDPRVDFFFTRVGPLLSIFSAGEEEDENRAVLTINLKEDAELASFMTDLKEKLPAGYEYEGVFSAGETRFNDILGITGRDVEVYVQGPSFQLALNAAESFRENLAQVKGLKDATLDYRPGVTEYRVTVDKEKALHYGMNASGVASVLKSLVGGDVASKVKEMNRAIEILVRPEDEFRSDWARIYQHPVKTRYGYVPLSELVRYEVIKSPQRLSRFKQTPTVKIFARVEGRERKKVVADIRDLFQRAPEREMIKYSLGGRQDDMDRSFASLEIAFLLSLALIYLILAAQFESLKYPFIVLFSVPYGLVGAVVLLFLTGGSFNIMTGVGVIVLTGIVINDDIVKIDFINQERKKGVPTREAVLRAGEKRFRPIVITTLTTVFGLLPLMFASGSGSELQKGLAVVIIGGMITGTALTLVMIPVFYELFSVNFKFFKKDEVKL